MNALEILISSRLDYEIYLYDLLVLPEYLETPLDFWEPVPVNLSVDEIRNLQNVITECDCIICYETHINFKNLSCCNNLICNGCAYKWFENSVKCPYCNFDQRT